MKFLIDAMGTEFGGVRTYVDQLVGAWQREFPDDEVHVLVPEGSTIAQDCEHRHEVPVGRPSVVARPIAQSRAVRRVAKAVSADAILAAIPATTLLRPSSPMAVVIHDLRHKLRPEQFSRPRRAMRRVAYGRAYALADGFISVSARTQTDLHELHASTRGRPSTVVHHGADHVKAWPTPDRTGPAVAFAHHTNKNPDLMIGAWEVLAARGGTQRLTIVGVGSADRERLQADIDSRGLRDLVELAPYLPEEAFRELVSSAAMIVFPSDFEGFGLPVVEGMALGKPVVIGPERATVEVAGGHAAIMADWTAEALADAVLDAGRMDAAAVDAARRWAETFTWSRTARETRDALIALTS